MNLSCRSNSEWLGTEPRHDRLREDRNGKGTWEYDQEDETPRNEVNERPKCMCNMSYRDG